MTRILKRVLFVEDEADIREVVKLSLESLGNFLVETCASGRLAIEQAPKCAPDLILLDVMMPGLDGPATLESLRRVPETADTPVVFITAKTLAHEVARYKDMGAVDVITKPFDPIALPRQLEAIWARHVKGHELEGSGV